MIELPESIQNTVKCFAKLPGVGEKTAMRQVMNLIRWNAEELKLFANAINDLGNTKRCNECGLYSTLDLCEICLSQARQESEVMCVVENINDLMAIERSGEYKGLYHVLGGVLNPLLGVGPDQLKLNKITDRAQKFKIKSIILAINPSVEGDATCSYIKQLLKDVHVDRIGFGMPMGGSLEYLDPLTISKALENRKRL